MIEIPRWYAPAFGTENQPTDPVTFIAFPLPSISFHKMSHIVLTGAIGLAGSAVLHYCLNSPLVSRISVLSRRAVDLGAGNEKLNCIVHKDFKTYPPEVLA
ncbi:hypothetical protein AA313_de0209781 [Arthrobotrys entomopaga]|nr:hypothetical protein AA313_de0209781 [Arthrobotrys entomopaga]